MPATAALQVAAVQCFQALHTGTVSSMASYGKFRVGARGAGQQNFTKVCPTILFAWGLAAPLSAGQLMAQLLSISRTANSLSGCETGSAWTDPNRMIIAVYLQLIGALQFCLLALPIYVSVKKIQHGRLHRHTGIQTSWHPSVPRSSSFVAAFKYDP